MATISGEKTSWTEAEATLQQLKAKKNKSNLFLIKSYSFIDKTNSHLNNNNNNNNNVSHTNNNNNNNNKGNKKATPDLRSPDMEPFPDIASLMLAQEPTKKARLKALQPKKQPKSSKAKRNKAQKNDPDRDQEQEQEQELSEQEAQLLRRNAHEYEELLEHLPTPTPHATLPRPQSLPGKVHFEAVDQALEQAHPIPAKRRGNNSNIKRESFLRQSLQSIRRSFGSNKHSSKHSIANGQSVTPLASPAGSSNASTSSTSSSTTSSYSSSTAISLLSKAQAQNHMLDEYLPTPVVLLLNDDLGQHSDISDGVYRTMRSTSSVVCTTTNNNHNNNSGTDDRATTSMAPPQLPTTSPTTATATTLSEQELQQQQQQRQQQQQHELHLRRQQYGTIQLSLPETFGPQFSSLPQSYSSSVGPLQSSGSAQSLGSSPSPSPRNSQVKGVNVVGLTAGSKGSKGSSSNTAKQHEQQSSAVAGISSTSTSSAAAAAAAAGVSLNNNGGMSSNGGVSSGGNIGIATYSVAAGGSVAAIPPEKEKKRKEVSSSRVKKFHRHFSQVSKDEKLINYFSCALVGDIPLQGHLYITEEHFAFYSNVFGYVTKVVIPTSSVTKISKEKTAKIIPNAVGVATADERHVFGSFISRESAFRLMCTVCTQLNPGAEILLPKPLQLLPVDVELTEEYLLDDDSSCSISGNESPPQLRDPAAVLAGDIDQQQQQQQQAFLRQRPGSDRHSEMQTKASLDVIDGPVTIRSSAPPVVHYEEPMQAHLQQLNSPGRHLFSSALPTVMGNGSGVSGSSASSSSSPVTVVGMGVCVAVPTTPINTGAPAGGAGGAGEGNPAAAAAAAAAPRSRWRLMAATARTRLSLDVPALTELQVLYLGITLAVLLAIFSVFLLYRVLDIEAKTSLYNMPVDFNAHGGNDDDIFAEALRWQRELQDKSTAEAQHILAKNLEQISKVRRSLETLSMLIHDRRAGYGKPQTDMDLMAQNGGAAAAGDVSD